MMQKSDYFLIFILGIFYSCSTTKIAPTSLKADELHNIALIETNSLAFTLNFENQAFKNDSLSKLQNKSFQETLIELKDSLRITSTVTLYDSTKFQKVLVAIIQHGFHDEYVYKMKSYDVPYEMDSLLRANNCKYGLLIINFGIYRDQYDEFKRRIGRNEINLKYDNYFPQEYLSKTYAALIDTSKLEFILFNLNEKKQNPLSPKTIKNQIKELFAGIFFNEG